MREIKFRIWNKKMGKFIATTLPQKFHLIPALYNVQQYTGLFDKNGVEIYEWDVVRMAFFTYTVEWHIGSAKFYLKATNDLDTHKYSMANATLSGEVIGNIWENPELINAPKEQQP